MKNTEAVTNEKNTGGLRLKKLTTEIVKMVVGDKVQGFYIGTRSAPWIDQADGEEKELTRVYFEKTKGGDKFILFQDSGLKNALANSMVTEGDHIVIEKLNQVSLKSGRKCNQYDIFAVQNA